MHGHRHHRALTRRAVAIGLAGSFLAPFALQPHIFGHQSTGFCAHNLFGYSLGDIEVTLINTDHERLSSVMAAANADVAERRAVCDTLGPFYVDNAVTLIDTGSEVALLDCGTSSLLTQKLACVGYAPEDITVIVFSHLHPEHLRGAFDGYGLRTVFPNARYIVSAAEHDFWMDDASIVLSDYAQPFMPTFRREARAYIEVMLPQLELVDWEDEIFPGARLVPAFGHTGGHSAIEVTSGETTLLHVGDLIVNPVLHLAQPDWYLRATVWPEDDVASRRTLMDRAADEHLLVQTVHFPFPGVGYVEKDGDAWRWLPLE